MTTAKKTASSTPAPTVPIPVAISYVRFSSPEQAKGDSLRRQTKATEDWCARNGVRLDTSLSVRDLGVSAFRGKHRSDKAALGGFLEAVNAGKVPRGSYLVIENLDRLSREEERTALKLWIEILDAGVSIVQLTPETVFRHERSDMTDIIRAIIELSRGHSESRMKSERISAYWNNQRKHARSGRLLTKSLPAWVRVESVERDSYTLALIPERAEAIRRIFALAAEGHGRARVVKRLNREGVAPFGRLLDEEAMKDYVERRRAAVEEGEPGAKLVTEEELAALRRPGHWLGGKWEKSGWNTVYLGMVLNDRRVLGEYQPKRAGRPDGPPLKDYFPPVIGEDLFLRAKAAIDGRNRRKGCRIGKHVDLFVGLIRDARDGGGYYATTRTEKRSRPGTTLRTRILVNYPGTQARGPMRSFPLPVFERAILSQLAELDGEDVLGEDGSGDAAAVGAELSGVRERLAELAELLAAGSAPRLIAAEAARLEAREAELTARLDEAREQEAKPLAESWRELRSLAGLLEDPDARVRLRAAIGRVVEEIRLLVVPRGRARLAAVQVWLKANKRDNEYRTYLLIHRPPYFAGRNVRPSSTFVSAVGQPEGFVLGVPLGTEDLRDPEEAATLAEFLEALPAETIDRLLAGA